MSHDQHSLHWVSLQVDGTWQFSMFAGIPSMSIHIISCVFPLIPPSSHFFAKECWVAFPNMRYLLKNCTRLSPYPCNIDSLLFNKLNLIETIFFSFSVDLKGISFVPRLKFPSHCLPGCIPELFVDTTYRSGWFYHVGCPLRASVNIIILNRQL